MNELKIDSNSIENAIFKNGHLLIGDVSALNGCVVVNDDVNGGVAIGSIGKFDDSANSSIYTTGMGAISFGNIDGSNSYIGANGGITRGKICGENNRISSFGINSITIGSIYEGDNNRIRSHSTHVTDPEEDMLIGSIAYGHIRGDNNLIESCAPLSIAYGVVTGNNSSIMSIGYSSIAAGYVDTSNNYINASGNGAVAIGCASSGNIIASGNGAVAIGSAYYKNSYFDYIEANGEGAIAIGINTHATRDAAAAFGYFTEADNKGLLVCGQYNKPSWRSGVDNQYAFVVGNGSGEIHYPAQDPNRNNAFSVNYNGDAHLEGTLYQNTTADYAEYFEWSDGNPENEDRIGHFVSIAADGKIQISNSTKETIGVISGFSSIIGNTAEDYWHGKYLRDIYGRYIYEDIEVNDDIDSSIDSSTNTHTEKRRKLNPEYDSSKEYIPRSQRKEWAVVGLLGQLIVDDDGTCQVGKRCGVTKDGTATNASIGFRVLQRLDDTHIKILFK